MSNKARKLSRRQFLAGATGMGVGLAVSACAPAAMPTPVATPAPAQPQPTAPSAQPAPQRIRWIMQTTWGASDFLQVNAQDLATMINEMSGGRLQIEVKPAGAIVPAFEVLSAVHKGTLEAGHSSPAYWLGKHVAASLFVGTPGGPFGMFWDDFLGWMYMGGGLELYNELLQKELQMDVVAFPAVAVPPEPLGWFNKPIKSLDDLKGLKFRSAGLAADVFKEVGMSVVTLPGGEVVPSLEKKVIDGAEWLAPIADMANGFQDVTKYYFMPSTHQYLNNLEILINKKKWEELPADLRAIVRYATLANLLQFTFKLAKGNAEALETLITKHKVQVMQTPQPILDEIIKAWDRVAERYAKQNAFFAKVLESQKQWAQKVVAYRRVAHPSYEAAADYYWGKLNPYQVTKP